MKKDIFIDNNIAKNFCAPADANYIELITWLKDSPEAHLVVSKKLLKEYFDSNKGATSNTSILLIIQLLDRNDRLINISKTEIDTFQSLHFNKTVEKKLRSNSEDRNHIPVVLLSERKMALTLDANFKYDLENFPRFSVIVSDRPESIGYK